MSEAVPEHPQTILVVDDEVRILAALKRSLRREPYRVLTAETPLEGLAVLAEESVDVVMTDHKMPGMSGLEFLARAADARPDVVRLIITGWTEAVPPEELKALNVLALVPKPWDDRELKLILRDAFYSAAQP
ncbi:MAG: response regulator [Proteobacteria bacterium]|nr:response regulator [Pseudomonadota bacterium]